MASRRTWILLPVATAVLALPALWVAHSGQVSRAQASALSAAGYGEFTTRGTRASPCRPGETAGAFLAQGRDRPEARGYLCTPLLGATRIRLDPSAPIDWD